MTLSEAPQGRPSGATRTLRNLQWLTRDPQRLQKDPLHVLSQCHWVTPLTSDTVGDDIQALIEPIQGVVFSYNVQ